HRGEARSAEGVDEQAGGRGQGQRRAVTPEGEENRLEEDAERRVDPGGHEQDRETGRQRRPPGAGSGEGRHDAALAGLGWLVRRNGEAEGRSLRPCTFALPPGPT